MNIYQPNFVYKNILEIDYNALYEKGIRLLLFDLDNTIAGYKINEVTSEIIDLFNKLKTKFKIILLSNSLKKRVEKFADALNIDYIALAFKPFGFNFKKAIGDKKKEECIMIGDQLFTDIKGGNKVGIYTILVNPLTDYDPIFSRLNRYREKKIKKKLGIV